MEKVISPDGTAIAYYHSGTGPPLVLVHGISASNPAVSWTTVMPAIEKHFTIYSIDRRGRGKSGDGSNYALEREFEDVAAVVNSITEPVTVLGHSFGGFCALEAGLLTRNIRRLVLYEPAPPSLKASPDTMAKMWQQLKAGDREGVLSTFLLDGVGVTPAELDVMRSAPAWQERVAAAHTILRELESIAALPPFDAERFEQLETPTLLLLGGDTYGVFRETIEQIHFMLPNSQIVAIPGQQHIAMITAPDLFVQAVLDFLLG